MLSKILEFFKLDLVNSIDPIVFTRINVYLNQIVYFQWNREAHGKRMDECTIKCM